MNPVLTQTPQLVLDMSLQQPAAFENYIAGPNGEALRTVRQSAEQCGEPLVFLWGSSGVGKTHLLQAACNAAAQRGSSIVYLPLAQASSWDPAIFHGLERLALVCCDDVQGLARELHWQEALFHFLNRARDAETRVLIGADSPPSALPLELADLRSRLGGGPTFRLVALTEDDRIKALHARARERGMELSDPVVGYLMTRFRRDIRSLLAMLDDLDRAAIAEHRKVTVPFVRRFFIQRGEAENAPPPRDEALPRS